MGNSNKKPQDYEVVRSFKPEEWVNKEKRPNCEIWQNTVRNVRADVYPIKSDISTADLDHYEMRYNNSQDIVKVHNIHINQDVGLCSKSSDAHVYVERIPLRLNNVNELTQPEALSVLRSCYSGFNTISTFYGPVEPYEDLICFNEQGHTKVWVNSNLALNSAVKQNQQNKVGNLASANTAYVNKILDLVQNRTSNGHFPARLKNKFREHNPKTYFEALNLVEEYAVEERIQIPNRINLRSGELSQTRTQFQNTVSKVSSYNGGIQAGGIPTFYQNGQNSYIPLDQSRHIINGNQAVIRPPLQQANVQYIGVPQPVQLNKMRSQNSLSFRVTPSQESIGFNQANSRVQNVAYNSRVIGPVPTTPVYHLAPTFSTAPLSPRNVQLPLQGSPMVKFQSPSKVIAHQQVKPFGQSNVQAPIKPDSPLKQVSNSPQRIVQEKASENLNEVSIQSQQSESRNIQPLQPQQKVVTEKVTVQTPRNVVNTIQETRVAADPIPNRIVINAQPNYQQFAVRPQRYVTLHQPVSNVIQQPIQAPFSFPAPYNDVNRTQIGQPIRPVPIIPSPVQQTFVQPSVQIQTVPTPPPPPIQQQQVNQQKIVKVQDEPLKQVQQIKAQVKQAQPQVVVPTIVNNQQEVNQVQKHEQYGYDEGYEEGGYEEEQVERELEQLHQQKLFKQHEKSDNNIEKQQHSEQQQHNSNQNYFPFAGQAPKRAAEELRRVQTTELREQEFHQISSPHADERQGNLKNDSDVVVPLQQTEKNIQVNPRYQQPVSEPEESQQGVRTSYERNTSYGYQYEYKTSLPSATPAERIPDDARYQDIEQYIRNKYRTYIGIDENPSYRDNSSVTPYAPQVKKVDQKQMYSYVESKYDQFSSQDMQFSFRPVQEPTPTQTKQQKPSMVSSYEYMRVEQMYGGDQPYGQAEIFTKQEPKKQVAPIQPKKEQNQDDILDVKNMERSLDKKYSSMRSNQQIKDLDSVKREERQENEFDVKKLEQNLMRFEQSINHTSNISEPRFQTSQVSKINSIDEKLGNRRSSMNRDFTYKDQTYDLKSYSYQNQSPVYEVGKKSRTSKISKQISDIDEKFSKYVKLGNALSSSSSKSALKQRQDNNGYQNYDYDSSSRMATGHFGYTDYGKGEDSKNYKNREYIKEKTTFVTSDVKSPSYEDLRKFMWS